MGDGKDKPDDLQKEENRYVKIVNSNVDDIVAKSKQYQQQLSIKPAKLNKVLL